MDQNEIKSRNNFNFILENTTTVPYPSTNFVANFDDMWLYSLMGESL